MHDDDVPGYLVDAYKVALDHGLMSLNLTRIGAGENRQWQCSSRFDRSSGYHVEIEADALEAVMKALGAWARLEQPAHVDPPVQKQDRAGKDAAFHYDLGPPAPTPAPAGGLFDGPDEPEDVSDADTGVSLFD